MGLGLMNKPAKICEKTFATDSEGFSSQRVAVLASIRVFVEGRHGSERWANLAAFSEAIELFRFRKIPNLNITTKQYIIFNDEEYDILSVENVKGRNMYIEVLAKKAVASNG